MAYETVIYDKAEYVATITMNRPEALNAFNLQLRADLMDALKQAEADPEVRCIILTGTGRAFSAGADVKSWDRNIVRKEPAAEPPSPLVPPPFIGENPLSYIMGMTKPVIAAINGVSVGMGATIPVSCDVRIMSDTARMAFIFVRRGIVGEYGTHILLPMLVGWGRAKELLLTGRFVYPKEAKEIGLVEQVVPAEELMSAARAMAKTIAENPPIAIRFTKRGFNMAVDASMRQLTQYEEWSDSTCMKSEDFKESVRAFLERREATYKGR